MYANQVHLLNAKLAKLLSNNKRKLEYVWARFLGEDFGTKPDHFHVTPDQNIILGKYPRYSEEHKRSLFPKIPFDFVSPYVDEVIDLLDRCLRKAPIAKEISDKRAEVGLHTVDVQAKVANMLSRNLERAIPLWKLALESQRIARSSVLEELKRELEPVAMELRLIHGRSEVPRNTPSKNAEILFELENKLRKCVVAGMRKAHGRNWWQEGIPEDIRVNAERRKQSQSLPLYYSKKQYPEIYYLTFADYAKVILTGDNWNGIFRPLFKDSGSIAAILNELNQIRRDVAHNRRLSKLAHLALVVNAGKLSSLIDSRKGHHDPKR